MHREILESLFSDLFVVNDLIENSKPSETKQITEQVNKMAKMNRFEMQNVIVSKIRDVNESLKLYDDGCHNLINIEERGTLCKFQENLFNDANKLKEMWKII